MQHVSTVDVLETTEDLVGEVADVVVAEVLRLQELIEVGLHQRLNKVDGLELPYGSRPQNIQNGYDLGGGG